MHRQRGLTLIELMVALTIGSLILLFLVEIFAQASTNARIQRNIAWMQEDGRIALEVISRELRLADYYPIAASTSRSAITGCTAPNTCGANAPASGSCAIYGANGVTKGSSTADVLVVSYLLDGSMSDCNGGANVGTPANPIRVVSCINVEDAFLQLGCSNQNSSTGAVTTAGSMQQALANIERFEVVYGVVDQLPAMTSIVYVPANQIPDGDGNGVPDWNLVISARVSILVRSRDDNLATNAQTYLFDANGDGEPESITATDRRLRQVFSAAVLLRNRIP